MLSDKETVICIKTWRINQWSGSNVVVKKNSQRQVTASVQQLSAGIAGLNIGGVDTNSVTSTDVEAGVRASTGLIQSSIMLEDMYLTQVLSQGLYDLRYYQSMKQCIG